MGFILFAMNLIDESVLLNVVSISTREGNDMSLSGGEEKPGEQ